MPIRLRLALVVAGASAVLLGLAGFLFVAALSHSLSASLDSGLSRRAGLAARALRLSGGPGAASAAGDARIARRLAAHQGNQLVQAVSPSGHLVALSGTGSPVLSRGQLAAARDRRSYIDVTLPGSKSEFRLLATPVASAPGWVVIVGTSLAPTQDAIARTREALALAGGPVVALAALGAWWLGRAALAPVERMRRRAAEISEHDTSARLEVPATRDELAALGRTMDDLISRLQGVLRRQRTFVADAGHELRTPLAMLRAELELAAHPERSKEELVEAISRASDDASRLSLLAEDLLVLATADEGHLALQRESSSLGALVPSGVEAFGARAHQHGLRLVLEVSEPDPVVDVDRVRLRQVLDNLLDNALRVSPAGSCVRVCARADGRYAVLEVTDEGPGFPPEFIPYAFDRFRRPDGARARAGGGAGLGLAIVQAIAVAHGGSAEVANQPAGGAAVRVFLPVRGAPPGRGGLAS